MPFQAGRNSPLNQSFATNVVPQGNDDIALRRGRHDDQLESELVTAKVVHELRNALGPLAMAVALLDNPGLDDEMLQTVRQILARQTRYMTRLVDDLWDSRCSRRGGLEVDLRPLDLATVVRDTCDDHRRTFWHEDLQFGLVLPEGPVPVLGDADRLTQILSNLLVNAMKFTRPGGRVDVELQTDPLRERAMVRVRDTGVGIDPQALPRLFDSYFQDRREGSRRDGLGLGLSLVKMLVELHDGDVWVDSKGIGQGAEFGFWIPLHIQPECEADALPGRRLDSDDDLPDSDVGFAAPRHGTVLATA